MFANLKILFIEDNPDDVRLITNTLKKYNDAITIEHIDSFSLFKDKITKGSYDLVLTDYNCGSFTGFDVVSEIRSRKIEVPIIIITGEHSLETALKAINMNVDDYVVKNKKYIEHLPAIIERVLNKSHLEEVKRNTDSTLNETLNNFINLYETSSVLIQSVWLDGHIMNVNNAWCNTFGYKNSEVKEIHIKNIIDPDWAVEFKCLMDKIESSTESIPFELGFITKEGRKVPVEGCVSKRIENRKIVATHWIMRNITKLKSTESTLCKINDQYLSMFEHAPNPMMLGDHRGEVLQINQAACDLVGYTYNEMIGTHIRKITHPLDLLKSLQFHKKLLSGELSSYTIEKRYRHKEGHYVKVEVNAALIRNDKDQPRFGIAEFKALGS